jgi:polysaccharide biosynthesis/export protein
MMKKSLFVFIALLLLAAGFRVAPCSAQDSREDAESYYKLGRVYYEQGRYKEAEELFQKSMDILSREQEKKLPPAMKAPPVAGTEQPSQKNEQFVAAKAPRASLAPRSEYLIGEDDSLQISVWQNQDLDGEVVVRPDGMISVPLVGDMQAVGLTLTQLTEDVTDKLSEYVKAPKVSVSIRKMGGKRVIILGQVGTQGVFSVGGARTIMDAIGLAGGFTRDAVPSSVVLIRGGFTGAKAQKINLSKVLQGDLRDNVQLQSEDIVFVPRKLISDVSYFLDQVLTPLSRGAYFSKEVQSW